MDNIKPRPCGENSINEFERIASTMTENEKWLLAMVLTYVFGRNVEPTK